MADRETLQDALRILERRFAEDVSHARSYPDDGVRDLVADLEETEVWPFIKREMERAEARRRGARGGVVKVEFDGRERQYVRALSSYLANRAEGLSEVRRFREEELGGHCLSEEEALERLRREELELRGLPEPETMNEVEGQLADEVWA